MIERRKRKEGHIDYLCIAIHTSSMMAEDFFAQALNVCVARLLKKGPLMWIDSSLTPWTSFIFPPLLDSHTYVLCDRRWDRCLS